MPMRRNRPKRESLNQAASLPLQLLIDDFEIADLAKYQTDFYRPLNRALRGLEQLTTADLLMAQKIDSAIAGSTIPRDMIVYRGLRRDVVSDLEPSDIFTDKGFCSCSRSETVVRD